MHPYSTFTRSTPRLIASCTMLGISAVAKNHSLMKNMFKLFKSSNYCLVIRVTRTLKVSLLHKKVKFGSVSFLLAGYGIFWHNRVWITTSLCERLRIYYVLWDFMRFIFYYTMKVSCRVTLHRLFVSEAFAYSSLTLMKSFRLAT